MNQELVQYLQQQIRTTDERLKRFTHTLDGKPHPRRFLYSEIEKYLNDFISKKNDTRMVVIPGFRGVGKTTLMAQICAAFKPKVPNLIFLSVEDARNLFGVGIVELMAAYESILGQDLESIQEPTLVFLDEIQSDPKWAATLKSLFEKTTNVFFGCTGSSAVVLQTTTDLARRAIFEKLPPLSFTEYEMIRNQVFPLSGLKESIKQAVYFSPSAQEAHTALIALQPKVNQYWTQVRRDDIREYLSCGTLPFALAIPHGSAVYDSISMLLDKIIKLDLPTLGNFDKATLDAVKRILFIMAENDATSLQQLEKLSGVNRLTIASVFESLEKAELLIRIPAYGSNMSVARKPVKYLFVSPAIRMSFFYITGQEQTYHTREGKLLEDSIGSHLYREFILKGQGAIRYDSAQGGADFILQIMNSKQLIIEVGIGAKDKRQILHTMKRISSDYNLIFSTTEVFVDTETNIVSVPLDFYFLM